MGRTGALSWFKRLDTYLYLIQDEYKDLSTLDWRLQHVAKRMVGPGGRNHGPPGGEVSSGGKGQFPQGHSEPGSGLGQPGQAATEGPGADVYGEGADPFGAPRPEHRVPGGGGPGALGAGHALPGAGAGHGGHTLQPAGRGGYKQENGPLRAAVAAPPGAGAEASLLGSPAGVANGGQFRTADTPRFDGQVRSRHTGGMRTGLARRTAAHGGARAAGG
jgi:hypothetical protein